MIAAFFSIESLTAFGFRPYGYDRPEFSFLFLPAANGWQPTALHT